MISQFGANHCASNHDPPFFAFIDSGFLDSEALLKLTGGLWGLFFLHGPKLSAKDRSGQIFVHDFLVFCILRKRK